VALIYLATYPRSGNSLLQRMLAANFWRLSSQIKAAPRPGGGLVQVKGWERAPAPGPIAGWPEPAVWDRRTAVYRRDVAGEPWRRQLLDVAAEDLGLDVRRALAAEAEAFFVKTHHLPFDGHLDGERVIQVVRHPGPALWSYYRLLARQALERTARGKLGERLPTLDRVISGDVQFGGWAEYHARWAGAAGALGGGYLKLDFAVLAGDQARARDRISAFLGLPVRSDEDISFERYSAKRAGRGLRGQDAGYEHFYSRGQLERLWEAHGEAARRYGFEPPDLEQAGPDEEALQLAEQLERASGAAGPP
jgi:hypothetical protein